MNYGTVVLTKGWWEVRCEPHVSARLKRVFARVAKGPTDVLRISATPENSRDLHWFLMRYPMEISEGAERALEQASDQHVDMELSLSALLDGRRPVQAFQLAKPPRDYQSFAATMLDIRGGLLLGDKVGLGKTVTAMLPMTVPENLPALVVVPTHMPGHWREKLAEFVPNLRVHSLRTGQPYPLVRKPKMRMHDLWDEPPDVILTNYHRLRGWAETLAGYAKYVVFDEVQALRHMNTGIYAAAKLVAQRARRRMGLSATPIHNYGTEFWPVVDALVPDALGTYEEFIREWCGERGLLNDTELFGNYLRREGIMIRRTRKEVGRELPPVNKIVHTIDADQAQLEKVKGDAVALARIIMAHNEAYRGQKRNAAGEFDSLMRQATGLAKAPFVAEFVRMLVQSGEKVLLFGWHREVYRIWLEKLKDLQPVLYTGSESPAQKDAAKRAFIDGDSQVMIMSLRSGAGVDGLQKSCRVVVFGELDWSPAIHEQNIGRLDRDEMIDPEGVTAYFLVSDEGSDPIVSDVCGVKREQIEGVMSPGEQLLERINTGENNLRQLAQHVLSMTGTDVPPEDSSVVGLRALEEEGA